MPGDQPPLWDNRRHQCSRTSCIGVYPEGGMVIRLFEK
jgi:hypothetical protein